MRISYSEKASVKMEHLMWLMWCNPLSDLSGDGQGLYGFTLVNVIYVLLWTYPLPLLQLSCLQ